VLVEQQGNRLPVHEHAGYHGGRPADPGGLQADDRQITFDNTRKIHIGGNVIVRIDEQPILDFDRVLIYLTQSTKARQVVTLTVIRHGKQIKLETVTIFSRLNRMITLHSLCMNLSGNLSQSQWFNSRGQRNDCNQT